MFEPNIDEVTFKWVRSAGCVPWGTDQATRYLFHHYHNDLSNSVPYLRSQKLSSDGHYFAHLLHPQIRLRE